MREKFYFLRGEGLRTIGVHLVLISLIECGSLSPFMSVFKTDSSPMR